MHHRAPLHSAQIAPSLRDQWLELHCWTEPRSPAAPTRRHNEINLDQDKSTRAKLSRVAQYDDQAVDTGAQEQRRPARAVLHCHRQRDKILQDNHANETNDTQRQETREATNKTVAAPTKEATPDLAKLGWDHFFAKQLEGDEPPQVARVLVEHRGAWRVQTPEGERWAECTGRMRHQATARDALPAVGDWVCIQPHGDDRATIHRVLERKSKFSRKGAGETTEEQIVAANIDTLFLVNALNLDFNLRRIERYLVLAWESGATPVILLTKADLCQDQDEIDDKIEQVAGVAYGVPTFAISALEDEGLDTLTPYLVDGTTTALLGSSGAGKSTLLNALLGHEQQKVLEVRGKDHKGMHTTTARELFFMPQGGMLIDTPGMRELQLWNGDEGLQQTFEDVEQLGELCRFGDCSHTSEPGCAVRQAIEDGELTQERYNSYNKLQRELAYLERKQDSNAQRLERKRWVKVIKQVQSKKTVY